MWKRQNVISTIVIIILVALPTHTLITNQRSYSILRTNYKLPLSFPKEIMCDRDPNFNLIRCAIMCQEMTACYMFCFNSGMCAMAIIGNGYAIFAREGNDECEVDESIVYTCFNNEKMPYASPQERILALDVSNVALMKPTKVQREYLATSNTSIRLVDGNLDRTRDLFCVDGDKDELPWVWLDLQAKYDVLAINITNNDNYNHKKRFHDAELRVGMNSGTQSTSSMNYFQNNFLCFEYTGIGDDYWIDFCHPGPILGMYVSLQIIKKCDYSPDCFEEIGNVINVCEIQVFVLNA